MEGGLQRYWNRRGYGRLYGSRRRRMNKAKLGGQGGAGSGRSKRSWRVKITRKLRLILSPKKLLIRLRDAYVNFMLRIENSNMMMMSRGGFGGADNSSFGGRGPLKEYDEKMIIEIYKSMVVAQGLMVSRDAPKSVVTQIGLSSSVEIVTMDRRTSTENTEPEELPTWSMI